MHLYEANSNRQKVQSCLPGLGDRKWKLLFNECRVSVWENEKILDMDDSDGCTM